MAMQIGVILGSGHGPDGTTGRLVADLLDRMRATQPDPGVDTVLTTSLGLGTDCPACLRCMTAGEQACPNFDAAAPARAAMDAADLVVFATPVHSFQVSASMKRFIDHFAYLIHRPAYVGTPAVLLSTAAGGGHDEALGYLRSAVRRWGFHTVAQLGANGPGPVDAAYWDERGWFDADWWTDQRPPYVANRIAAMVEKKIRKGIASGSADPYRG